MKTWWLKLYTIPTIKEYSVVTLVFLIVHWITISYFPDHKYATAGLILLMMIWPFIPRKSSFSNQFSFHLMSVHKKQLKNAYLADFFLSTSAQFVLWFLCLYYWLDSVELLSSFNEKQPVLFSNMISHGLNVLCGMFILKSLSIRELTASPAVSTKKKWKNLFIAGSFFLIPFTVFHLINNVVHSPGLSAAFLMMTFLITSARMTYKELFHQCPKSVLEFKLLLKPVIYSPVALILLGICNLFFFSFEHGSNRFYSSVQAREYASWGSLAPRLERKHFIKYVKASPSTEELYKKAPVGYEKISLMEIFGEWNKKSLRSYTDYLQNAKLDHQNALFLSGALNDPRNIGDTNLYSFESALLNKWPSDLPKTEAVARIIHRKESRDRSIASESRLKTKEKVLDRY